MKCHERMKNFFAGKPVDRLPMLEWAPWWGDTIERWNKEGLNLPYRHTFDGIDIQHYFGLDGCMELSHSS